MGRAASPLAAGKGGLQRFGRAGSPDPAGAWGMEQNKFVMNHENICRGRRPRRPGWAVGEILVWDIWQGFSAAG